MRVRCLDTVYKLAKLDPNVVFIGSDLGAGTLDNFKTEMPERFFMEGISEQHIIGMAAGLAMSGKEVYVNTIATFLTRRCYEQIVIDLGLSKAKVRLIGSGGGVVYAPLGPTHLATDDLALMRAVPNMTILAPADAHEMEQLVRQCPAIDGPVYIRVAKGGDPILTADIPQITIGKATEYRQGRDVLLVTTGILLGRCIELADRLDQSGSETAILHVNTLSPFDRSGLLAAAKGKQAIFSFEEHIAAGGLGSLVAQTILESAETRPRVFKPFSLGNGVIAGYGSQESLLSKAGLDVDALQATIIATLDGGH